MNYSNSYPWAVKFAENLVHLLLRPPYLFSYHNDLLPVRWEYYWRSSASWQYSHRIKPPRSVQGWVLITYYLHCIKCENLLLVTRAYCSYWLLLLRANGYWTIQNADFLSLWGLGFASSKFLQMASINSHIHIIVENIELFYASAKCYRLKNYNHKLEARPSD